MREVVRVQLGGLVAVLGVWFFFTTGCGRLPPQYVVEPGNPTFGYNVPNATRQPRGDLTLAIVRPVQEASSTILGVQYSGIQMVQVAPGINLAMRRNLGAAMTEGEVRQRIAGMLQGFLDSSK